MYWSKSNQAIGQREDTSITTAPTPTIKVYYRYHGSVHVWTETYHVSCRDAVKAQKFLSALAPFASIIGIELQDVPPDSFSLPLYWLHMKHTLKHERGD